MERTESSPSAEQKETGPPMKRQEELRCYVSFQDISDPDIVLGLGVYVHPLKKKDRERGHMELDLVYDYLTKETFEQGVQHFAIPEDSDSFCSESSDDEREKREQPLPSMTSSVRGRINGWLPIFINARHWGRASIEAPAAFAALATGRQLECFQPMDALNVCCKLLTCAVVGFTVGQSSGNDVGELARNRGKASDKAVQMYADVHRLFLQIAHDIPEVREQAYHRLRAFIDSPSGRTKIATPHLGDLIQCLLITDEITWEHLAPTFIPEAVRRHVYRGKARQRTQHESWLSFAEVEDFYASSCKSVDELISSFDKFAPRAGMVSSFCVMFYHIVGRPRGHTVEQVMEQYDRNWGHLSQELRNEVVEKCARLCQTKSIHDTLPPMFPSGSCTEEDIAELILWADIHGQVRRTDVIESWPRLDAPHLLLDEWKRGKLYHRGGKRSKGGWKGIGKGSKDSKGGGGKGKAGNGSHKNENAKGLRWNNGRRWQGYRSYSRKGLSAFESSAITPDMWMSQDIWHGSSNGYWAPYGQYLLPDGSMPSQFPPFSTWQAYDANLHGTACQYAAYNHYYNMATWLAQ